MASSQAAMALAAPAVAQIQVLLERLSQFAGGPKLSGMHFCFGAVLAS